MNEKVNIIKEVIEEIRPYLNMEGGDIEFIKYDEKEKTIYVKMLGACVNCIAQDETLELNLLYAIKEKLDEVEKIVNVPL